MRQSEPRFDKSSLDVGDMVAFVVRIDDKLQTKLGHIQWTGSATETRKKFQGRSVKPRKRHAAVRCVDEGKLFLKQVTTLKDPQQKGKRG